MPHDIYAAIDYLDHHGGTLTRRFHYTDRLLRSGKK